MKLLDVKLRKWEWHGSSESESVPFWRMERNLMTQIIRLEDLSAAEVSRLLAAHDRRLPDNQEGVGQKCACDIACIKKACDMLKSLRVLEEAA